MAAAATLLDAANLSLSNVQLQRDLGNDLRALGDNFISGFVALFTDDSAAERTVLDWAIPFSMVNVTVDPLLANQTQVDTSELGMVLFRLMSAAADAEANGRISVGVSVFLLLLYNLNWG